MNATNTSELVEAYSLCPRKAFLLLRGDPQEAPHDFCRVIEDRAAAARTTNLTTREQHELPSDLGKRTVDGARGVSSLCAGDLRADCDALVPLRRGGSPGQYEPQLVAGTVTITQGQRIRLAFAAHVLAEKGSRCSKHGTVVPLGGTPQRIRLQPLYPQVKAIIDVLREWSTGVPADPPPLVLARHCAMCPFHTLCHKEAEKQDNLSLLERMTPKVMQKYRKRGIFTIEQLSYA